MNNEERIRILEEAQELILDAVAQIRAAVSGTSMERSADAYIIAHLENWAEGTNPYDDTSIPQLIDYLESEEDEEDEE